jgi:hypothetical protein
MRAEQRHISDDRYELLLTNGARKFGINIRVGSPRDQAPVRLRLEAAALGDQPAAEFSVVADPKTGMVTASATVHGSEPVVKRAKLAERDEAHLLFEELEMFGHDARYERSLHEAANMLDPNYRRELVKGSLLV